MTALKFAELSVKAGIPPGVINVVPGTGRITGQAIADHKKIRKLGFTGSTGVGHTIMGSAVKSNIKKVSLELGGKSPLIIFSDFDIDRAVKIAMGGAFFNKGENCIAAGRIFVEETIYVMQYDSDTNIHWAMTDVVTTRDDVDRKFGIFTYEKGCSFVRMVEGMFGFDVLIRT